MKIHGKILMIAPVVVDLLALLVLISRLGVKSLQTPSGVNGLVLGVLYSLLCVGVYMIRKLTTVNSSSRWYPPAWLLNTKVRAVLALSFGLMLVTMLAFQLGYFASALDLRTTGMGEGDSAAFFVFAPGAWLGFSMLYILVLAFPVNSNIDVGSRKYVLVAILGLFMAQGMLLFTVLQIQNWFLLVSGSARLIVGVLALLCLLIAFVPPRMLYQKRLPYLPGWISLVVLVVISFGLIIS